VRRSGRRRDRAARGHIDAAAGEPVRLDLNGRLEQTPVRLRLSTGSFADFAGDSTRVPFAMAAQPRARA